MQVLVISKKTLEFAFLLSLHLFVFVYLFFLVDFWCWFCSIPLLRVLPWSPRPFTSSTDPAVSFHRRTTVPLFAHPCAQRRATGPVILPLQTVLALDPSTHPSTHPSTPLNPRPKGSDPLLPKFTPSELKNTRIHSICTANSRGLCKAPLTIYVWKDGLFNFREFVFYWNTIIMHNVG